MATATKVGNTPIGGPLGIDVTDVDGFDVSGGTGQTAYAVLSEGGTSTLHRIDLATGAATSVGTLQSARRGLALA